MNTDETEQLLQLNRDYVRSVQDSDVKHFEEILAPERLARFPQPPARTENLRLERVTNDTAPPVLGVEPVPQALGMVMEIDGAVASTGAGAACLGHPLNAAAWLAATLAARGEPLQAGDIILTGALGPMVGLEPGNHVYAKIGGLGTVSFTYGKAA